MSVAQKYRQQPQELGGTSLYLRPLATMDSELPSLPVVAT